MKLTHTCLQLPRPAQEQKQSPLGSPETAGQKRQQAGPGQVGKAPDPITHCTEHVGSSTASSIMAAATEPSLSSSTSVGVPAADSVTLAAATDGLAPQTQAVEGVHDAQRQQEAVLAADDTSVALATAEGSKRKYHADQSAAKKAAKPRQGQQNQASLSGSIDATPDESSGMNTAVVVASDSEPGQSCDDQGNSSASVAGPSTGGSLEAQQAGVGHSPPAAQAAARIQGCNLEPDSSASVSTAAAQEAAAGQRRSPEAGSAVDSKAAAGAAVPCQDRHSQAGSSLVVSTADLSGSSAGSQVVRTPVGASQSSGAGLAVTRAGTRKDPYEYPFSPHIRWLKKKKERLLGAGATAQVFRCLENCSAHPELLAKLCCPMTCYAGLCPFMSCAT